MEPTTHSTLKLSLPHLRFQVCNFISVLELRTRGEDLFLLQSFSSCMPLFLLSKWKTTHISLFLFFQASAGYYLCRNPVEFLSSSNSFFFVWTFPGESYLPLFHWALMAPKKFRIHTCKPIFEMGPLFSKVVGFFRFFSWGFCRTFGSALG